MIEQIVMGALGKQFDSLRLVGGAVNPPAHFHRDHRILLAVQDENRGLNGADVALMVVFVGNQQAERQPKIGPPRHIDRRGERRFQHDRGDDLSAASRTAWPEPSDLP